MKHEELLELAKKEGWEFIATSGPIDDPYIKDGYGCVSMYSCGTEYLFVYNAESKKEYYYQKFESLKRMLDAFLMGMYKPLVEVQNHSS